jgi:PAS domain S-box-containing protein
MAAELFAQVQELLAALLEQSRDHALLLLNLDGKVVWASAGAERIFGRQVEEFLGDDVSVYFVPEDVDKGVPEHELQVARSQGSAEDDRWTLRPDGSRFWASGLSYALRNKAGELIGYGKIIQNRTDWKQQLDALRNQVEDHQRRERSKNRMISTLAHELRNPLAPLLNAAHLLRRGAPVDYPVEIIERQIETIRRLVDDLLETSGIHAGKIQLRRDRVALQDVVARAVETVRPLLDRHAHDLDVLVPPVSIEIEGDATRLQQVFANLLTNAAKYTPREGKIWLKATVEGEQAVVRVKDNGSGIAPDMLSQIFELFVQVNPTTASEGVGIGLSVVKELVELHGGTVQANSDGIGTGSEFTVRLPSWRDGTMT